jgi:phage tail sheath protein FI
MPNYLHPGVYVEEVDSGVHPIQSVGTSVAAVVGQAPLATAAVNVPTRVDNWSQFLNQFVGRDKNGNFNASTDLSNAAYGFFVNGGTTLYVTNVGKNNPIKSGLDALAAVDEVAIVAAPGYTDGVSYDALLTHCELLKDRVAILDCPVDATVESMKDVPNLLRKRIVRLLPAAATNGHAATHPRVSPGGYGAVYFPWIRAADPLDPQQAVVPMPPSGHMAGIYARTDATRGVHKAPANEPVRSAVGVVNPILDADQDALNPLGVNCIRFFSSKGVIVWGARTLADPASDWRYVNVRRLFNMIEESIQDGTSWVVFEPNDSVLWKSIRRDVGDFMTRMWRDGALVGGSPEEAFFVKCDAETNPSDVVNAGSVVTLIGAAPVRPAEFVVFRISQSAEAFAAVEGA